MPKRIVKVKLIVHAGMERFRLRTRKEIKRYINARVKHARGSRKHGKVLLKSAREKKAYWHKPDSFMVVHKLIRREIKPIVQFHANVDSTSVFEESKGVPAKRPALKWERNSNGLE